jgi:hypothetical protein
MPSVEDFIQTLNSQAKTSAIEISKELSSLLQILEKKGVLREKLGGTLEEKRQIIVEAQRNNDAILAAFNKYYAFYFDLGKREKFLEFMRSNAFTDLELMHLLHSQLIFAFLVNMETFKNLLNLILKDSSSENTLGNLFHKKGILYSNAPEIVNAIAKRLDIDLRNALSHYTFTEEGPFIHYYSYKKEKQGKTFVIKLSENRIKSTTLYEKNMEASLMKVILGCLIADMYGN